MKKKNKFTIEKLGEIICVVVLLTMTLLTFINVCSRFIFHASIAASEEITTNLFVVLSLVGAALAALSRSHIGLNVFTDMMKPKLKTLFRLFEGVAGMFFFGFLTYYGAIRVVQQFDTGMISAGLGIPMWIYGLFCLLGFFVLFAVFMKTTVVSLIHLVHNQFPEDQKEEGIEA